MDKSQSIQIWIGCKDDCCLLGCLYTTELAVIYNKLLPYIRFPALSYPKNIVLQNNVHGLGYELCPRLSSIRYGNQRWISSLVKWYSTAAAQHHSRRVWGYGCPILAPSFTRLGRSFGTVRCGPRCTDRWRAGDFLKEQPHTTSWNAFYLALHNPRHRLSNDIHHEGTGSISNQTEE